MNLRYTERALKELDDAITWYEAIQHGLGLRLLDQVEASLLRIQERPYIYQKVYDSFRACFLQQYPYSIFYTIEAEEIVIHAVFDNRQHPNKKP